jgi:hypothetical protein
MPRFELLAIDLDGTLFDSSRQVPEANRHALSRAAGEGVRIVVITGRRLPAALPPLAELDIDPLLVLNSGALIKDGLRGAILRRKFLSAAVAKNVLAEGRAAGAKPILHDGPDGEGYLLVEPGPFPNSAFSSYLEKTNPPARPIPDLAAHITRDPVQIGFAATVSEVRALAERFSSSFAEQLSLARTEYPKEDLALLDVLAPEATKASAVEFLARQYGIAPENTMAIGDNWNDLDMLEQAGFAVMMSNAPPELLARGFAMTGSNDEAGVAQAIERWVLS